MGSGSGSVGSLVRSPCDRICVGPTLGGPFVCRAWTLYSFIKKKLRNYHYTSVASLASLAFLALLASVAPVRRAKLTEANTILQKLEKLEKLAKLRTHHQSYRRNHQPYRRNHHLTGARKARKARKAREAYGSNECAL